MFGLTRQSIIIQSKNLYKEAQWVQIHSLSSNLGTFTCSPAWRKNVQACGDFQIYSYCVRTSPNDWQGTYLGYQSKGLPNSITNIKINTAIISPILPIIVMSRSPVPSFTFWMTLHNDIGLIAFTKCPAATWIECSMHLLYDAWLHAAC